MNEETQIRFNIAMNMKDKTIEEMQKIFEWVRGPEVRNPAKSTIVPATNMKIVK